MGRVSLQEIYQPSSNLVAETTIDEQLVLVPIDSSDRPSQPVLMTLNPVGLTIWRRLDGRVSLEVVIETLCRDYQGEKQLITEDVCEFVDDLLLKGLLVKSPASRE